MRVNARSELVLEALGPGLTLEHAVVGLPVSPPQSVPESQGLRSFVTLVNCHFAATVQPGLQGTSAESPRVFIRPRSEGSTKLFPTNSTDWFTSSLLLSN